MHPNTQIGVAVPAGAASSSLSLSPTPAGPRAKKHLSRAHRSKIGKSMMGNKNAVNHRGGYRRTPATRAKISKGCAGKGIGDKNPMRRPDVRAKNAIAHIGIQAGDKNPNWLGGISREPYAWTFNAELKEEVRRRDGHKCQLCGIPQAKLKRALDVHHSNYDKKDIDPDNLVSLCRPCHMRTNTKRAYWKAFFKQCGNGAAPFGGRYHDWTRTV